MAFIFVFISCFLAGGILLTGDNSLSGLGCLEEPQSDTENLENELYSSSTISNAQVEGWHFDFLDGKYKTNASLYANGKVAVATIAFNSSERTTISVNLEIWGDVGQSTLYYSELDNCMVNKGSLEPGGSSHGGAFKKTVTYNVSAGYHYFQIEFYQGKGKGGTYAYFELPFIATNTFFEIDSCSNISFSLDGSVIMEKYVPVGEVYGFMPTPKKTGYTFAGWYTGETDGTRVESTTIVKNSLSHTLYARYILSGYQVSLSGDAGINTLSGAGLYDAGASVTIRATMKSGYSFLRWSDGNTSASRTITNLQSNLSLVAYSTGTKYTVTFDPNGGKMPITYEGSGIIQSSTYISPDYQMSLEAGDDGFFELPYAQEYGYEYQIARIYVESYEDLIAFEYKITGEVGLDYAIFGTPDYSFTEEDIRELAYGYTDEYDHYDAYYSYDNPYDAFFDAIHEDSRVWQMVNAPGRADYIEQKTIQYDLSFYGYFGGDSFYIDIAFIHLSFAPNRPNKASFWFKMDTVPVQESNTKTVTFGSTYGTLPTPVRANYAFDGWYTAASGGTKVTSTTTYSTPRNTTVYAHWTLISKTINVHIRLIDMDGSYMSVDNNIGGSVDVSRYVISGLTSAEETRSQTEASYSYVVHAAQRFQMTPKANAGYVFVGCSTSSTPSSAIKTPASVPFATYTSYPNGNYNYYVYFKKTSENQLKYDEIDKYFYFEDGYYPQSEATNSSTLNNSATATGESFTYCDGKSNVTIPVYGYENDRYVKIVKNGMSAWFKFEPIRWRISDYGVAKTERNIQRYASLYNLRNYTSFMSGFTAVSDLILGVGAMHSTRSVQEGMSVTEMDGFVNVLNVTDEAALDFNYSTTDYWIDVCNYATFEQSNTINLGVLNGCSHPLNLVSVSDMDYYVGLVNKQARASDMVAFILGLENDQVSYWTRDLSNLGAGVAISPSGTIIRPWLDEVLGMRFTYIFREGMNIDFYS